MTNMGKNKIYNKLYFVYQQLAFYITVFMFLLSGLLVTIVGLLLSPFLSRSQAHSYGRKSMHYGSKILFLALSTTGIAKVDFEELNKLRDVKSLIITPNHPCLMDALFVASRLPNVICVVKGSVLSNPLFYGYASLGGFIRNDSPVTFVQQCQETLGQGAQLLLFPEGTRTLPETKDRLKEGFSLIAQRTGVGGQTVFIEANSSFLGKNWPLWKVPDFPLVYRTRLGKRFSLQKGEDRHDFIVKYEKYFKSQVDKIKQ